MGPEANSCPSRDRDLVEVLGVAPACQRGARVVIRTIENANVKALFGRDPLLYELAPGETMPAPAVLTLVVRAYWPGGVAA
jgi:hypothetical protein